MWHVFYRTTIFFSFFFHCMPSIHKQWNDFFFHGEFEPPKMRRGVDDRRSAMAWRHLDPTARCSNSGLVEQIRSRRDMSSTTNLLTYARGEVSADRVAVPSILEGFCSFSSPFQLIKKRSQTSELGCSIVISLYLIEQKMYHYYMVSGVSLSAGVVMTITVW